MTFERYLEILAEYDIRIWTKPKNLETLTEEEVRKFAAAMQKEFNK